MECRIGDSVESYPDVSVLYEGHSLSQCFRELKVEHHDGQPSLTELADAETVALVKTFALVNESEVVEFTEQLLRAVHSEAV